VKFLTLGEDGDFLVEGTIHEMKSRVIGDVIAFDDLLQITVGNGGAVLSLKDQKAEGDPFGVANGNLFCGKMIWL